MDQSLAMNKLPTRQEISRELARSQSDALVDIARKGYLAYPDAPEFFAVLGLASKAPVVWQQRMQVFTPDSLGQVPPLAVDIFAKRNHIRPDLCATVSGILGHQATFRLVAASLLGHLPRQQKSDKGFAVTRQDTAPASISHHTGALRAFRHAALDHCTVVVYSNRPRDLNASITFHRELPFRTLFIADIDDDALAEARELTNDRTTVMVGGSFVDRLALAMDAVDTPFVHWMGDDDFISPPFLAEAAKRLHSSSEIGSVVGRGRNLLLTSAHDSSDTLRVTPNRMVCTLLRSDAPAGRLRELCNGAGSMVFHLFRSDAIRSATDCARRLGLHDNFFEILIDFTIALSGRVETVPRLSVVRQRMPGSGSTVIRQFLEIALEHDCRPLIDVRRACLEIAAELGVDLTSQEVETFISGYLAQQADDVKRMITSRTALRHDDALTRDDRYIFQCFALALAERRFAAESAMEGNSTGRVEHAPAVA